MNVSRSSRIRKLQPPSDRPPFSYWLINLRTGLRRGGHLLFLCTASGRIPLFLVAEIAGTSSLTTLCQTADGPHPDLTTT